MHNNGREPRVLLGDQTRVEFRALVESQRTQMQEGFKPMTSRLKRWLYKMSKATGLEWLY